ncbi:MAG: IS1595 family transposase, partial [Rhizobiales bacterium]|nr:IS1595 family transposase [Hyphomicrobiales bacterium]
PLQGDVEVDESSIPYYLHDGPSEGGQGKSLVGKIFIIGAVEMHEGRTSGRIRLAKLIEDKRRYIQPFVLANTAPGCAIYTDANRSYVGIPDRKHFPTNLSAKDARPAHESFERIHRVFSNLKRWGLGTFHGFREKHLDAYLHEFEFRWNRRRRFRSTLDTLLGIGQSLPRTTYRDIVGDTSEWRQAHKEQILAMVSLERREAAKHLARVKKIDILDALEMV